MPDKKKILVMTQWFPPSAGSGAQRPLKFVKFLPEFGWEPTVLCFKPDFKYPRDETLMDDVQENLPIHRVGRWQVLAPFAGLGKFGLTKISHKLVELLSIPDGLVGWIPPALFKALRLQAHHGFDAIYSSSPSHSVHIATMMLNARLKKPWIADFRDDWSTNPEMPRPTRFHLPLQRWLELKVIRAATKVVTASPRLAEQMRATYPEMDEKFEAITNGYDPDDFLGEPDKKDMGKFTVLFTGAVYGLVDPRPFLTAAKELIDAGAIPKEKLSIRFMGSFWADKSQLNALGSVCKLTPYTPHDKTIAAMKSADCLLALLDGSPNRLLGKIFEYFYTGKPIIGVVPENGVTADMLRQYGAALISEPGDIPGIKTALLKCFMDWEADRTTMEPRKNFVRSFNRRALTGRLASLLDEAS